MCSQMDASLLQSKVLCNTYVGHRTWTVVPCIAEGFCGNIERKLLWSRVLSLNRELPDC